MKNIIIQPDTHYKLRVYAAKHRIKTLGQAIDALLRGENID